MALEIHALQAQLQNLIAQKDQFAQSYQQCVGAICIVKEQIKLVTAQEEENKETSDGQIIEQEQGEASQE